jgi:fluoride exporter
MNGRELLLVGIGGALGSIARFLCQKYIYILHPVLFPWGTLLVNISGCLLIGVLYGLSEKGQLISPEWRLFLATGICGGFTTFSSFAYENVALLRAGHVIGFSLYTASSVVLGILAAYLGVVLIKLI